MMRHVAILLLAAVLTGGVLAGCGGNESSPGGQSTAAKAPETPSPTPAQPAAPEIVISDHAFAVPPSVRPGERITLVNKDDEAHSVTANQDNLFDVRVSGGGGKSALVAPNQPGSYEFHCKYHANMAGTLTVK